MKKWWIFGLFLAVLALAGYAKSGNTINKVNNPDIKNLIEYTYPKNTLKITEQEIEQIMWLEDASLYKSSNLHVEIPRILTKLYCLELLRSGTRQAYAKFIEAQIIHNNQAVLKYSSFKELSQDIKKLDPIAYKALRLSILLASISNKAPKALELALAKLGKDGISNDYVDFMSKTMTNAMDIFPLAHSFAVANPSYTPLLKVAFLNNAHLKHMLYTEGGISMFKNLRVAIKLKAIDKDKLHFWYCHWLINIAGFKGDIAQNGSVYLNEDTFIALKQLQKLVFKLLYNPNYDPLEPYLLFRARLLGINKSKDKKTQMVLAHVGSILRLYNKKQGEELIVGFNSLSAQKRKKITEQLYANLMEYETPTARYAPALFAAGMEYTGYNIKKTLTILLPVYAKTILLGSNLRKSNIIDKTIPISFINLAQKDNLQKLFSINIKNDLELVINKDGLVTIIA